MKKGLTQLTKSIGAASFTCDLPLESRDHFIELSKNIESINRYFQLPYDESMSTNYCHKCLTAEGTTPTHWQTQLELCGHNATAACESITNQYIQAINTKMHEWYESLRMATHDQISAAVAAMSDDGQDDRTSIRTARFDFPIHCHLITNLTRSLFNALG